jgi:hypothetical protein
VTDDPVLEEIQPESDIGQVTRADQWKILPWTGEMSTKAKRTAMRLNALGDPYFHGKVVLGFNRMVGHLHGAWLKRLSDPGLHMVLQAPRDHFKTTTGTVTLASWWVLPFGAREEDWMRSLGYGDEWIRYMYRIHSADLKIAISSETEPNAILMGMRYDDIYQKNAIFREVFDDLIPGTGANWNQLNKTHNREKGSGEGTFSMLGVGTVLQSRHFNRAIHDDLFGEEALYSESTREKTIDWHRKFPGAFDTDVLAPGFLNLELVTGNRWGLNDLNSHIMENDPSFLFETHSAEGGCCPDHPAGQPIFPEEFTMERLAQLRVRFGVRSYSAHYLNMPVSEEECAFRKNWLPRFRLLKKEMGQQNDGTLIYKTVIERISANQILEDIPVSDLDRFLILDPNHGGERGRARHAAVVCGTKRRADGRRDIYQLEAWAAAVSHDKMIGEVGRMAERWRVQKFYVETIAGQDGWMHYFERDLRDRMPQMVVTSLPKERGSGAKDRRIMSMSPLYERGQVWIRATGGGSEEFMREYELYPNARTVDLADCMGYCFNIVESPEIDMNSWRRRQAQEMERRSRSVGSAGY